MNALIAPAASSAPPPGSHRELLELRGRRRQPGDAGSAALTGLRRALAAGPRRIAAAVLLAVATSAFAAPALPLAADPELEARVMKIAAELRCLVCQNQTIADSHAGLAVDLRNQVRDMLREGKSERDVLSYMTARYGDFVLYRPPLKESTALLWLGPGALFAIGFTVLVLALRRRARAGDEAFEPDPEALVDGDEVRGGPRPVG